jgi:hypothetical protein
MYIAGSPSLEGMEEYRATLQLLRVSYHLIDVIDHIGAHNQILKGVGSPFLLRPPSAIYFCCPMSFLLSQPDHQCMIRLPMPEYWRRSAEGTLPHSVIVARFMSKIGPLGLVSIVFSLGTFSFSYLRSNSLLKSQ